MVPEEALTLQEGVRAEEHVLLLLIPSLLDQLLLSDKLRGPD